MRAGALATMLSEEGSLGRGSTAKQLRAITELVKVQATKIDILEDHLADAHEILDDVIGVLPAEAREKVESKVHERQQTEGSEGNERKTATVRAALSRQGSVSKLPILGGSMSRVSQVVKQNSSDHLRTGSPSPTPTEPKTMLGAPQLLGTGSGESISPDF